MYSFKPSEFTEFKLLNRDLPAKYQPVSIITMSMLSS